MIKLPNSKNKNIFLKDYRGWGLRGLPTPSHSYLASYTRKDQSSTYFYAVASVKCNWLLVKQTMTGVKEVAIKLSEILLNLTLQEAHLMKQKA